MKNDLIQCMVSVFDMIVRELSTNVFANAPAQDEYDILRNKRKIYLVGTGTRISEDAHIQSRISEINAIAQNLLLSIHYAQTDSCLWSDLDSGTSADITDSYNRLKSMAVAYCTAGAPLFGDQNLKSAVLAGMDWMYQNKYNESITAYGNWWDWEIGASLWLNDLVVLMYDDLSSARIRNYMNAIGHFQKAIQYTGANRMWQINIRGIRGIIIKDSAQIQNAVNGLPPLFSYVSGGDGFYDDGSCLFHGDYSYTGGYGRSQFSDMVQFAWLLDGTQWSLPNEKVSILHSLAADTFEPLLYNGGMMGMASGRTIARNNEQLYSSGAELISTFALLSQIDQTGAKINYSELIKKNLEKTKDLPYGYYSNASVFKIDLVNRIIDSAQNYTYSPKYVQFAIMDKAVAQRNNWACAVSMYSDRTRNYESINDENIKGWHLSDGMTYLYDSDVSQYDDNYWCTVDMYRLPGTTVAKNTQNIPNSYGTADRSVAGGVSLNNGTGISAQKIVNSNIESKKVWIALDDKMINLGAGINTRDGNIAETIVENRKINGDNRLVVNGIEQSSAIGWTDTIDNVQTVFLQGNEVGSDVGYYFPSRTALRFLRETRTGSWSQINQYPTWCDTTSYSRNYLTIWDDHGLNADNENYAYVTIPNCTAEKLESLAQNSAIRILKNTENIQAAEDADKGITGFVFWTGIADSMSIENDTIDGLACSDQAIILRSEQDRTVSFAVCDPTMGNSEIIFSYNYPEDQYAQSVLKKSDEITVLSLNPLKVSVNTENSRGKTFYISLNIANREDKSNT